MYNAMCGRLGATLLTVINYGESEPIDRMVDVIMSVAEPNQHIIVAPEWQLVTNVT